MSPSAIVTYMTTASAAVDVINEEVVKEAGILHDTEYSHHEHQQVAAAAVDCVVPNMPDVPPAFKVQQGRRTEFTAEQKLQILAELDSEHPPSIQSLSQKWGVSVSSLHRWRQPAKRERLQEMVGALCPGKLKYEIIYDRFAKLKEKEIEVLKRFQGSKSWACATGNELGYLSDRGENAIVWSEKAKANTAAYLHQMRPPPATKKTRAESTAQEKLNILIKEMEAKDPDKPNLAVKRICQKYITSRAYKSGELQEAVDSNGMNQKHRKICTADGCTNTVVNCGVCKRHGAKVKSCRKICTTYGCTNKAKKGGVCVKHGAKVEYKLCSIEGCTKYVQRRGVCIKHGAKVKRCIIIECTNQARKGGVCWRHRA